MTAQEKVVVGGWTALHPLDAKEKEIFAQVTQHLIGATYKALEVRSQLVNGTNYQYVADQTIPGYPQVRRVAVDVYAPLKGNPVLTGIKPLLLD